MADALPSGWRKQGACDYLYIGPYVVIVGAGWWAVRRRNADHDSDAAASHATGDKHRAALTALLTLIDTARAEVVGAMDDLNLSEP